MENLAVTYSNQEKYEEAEELEVKVLDLCTKVLGQEHPHTLTLIENLAKTYKGQGKMDLDLYNEVLGPEHSQTLTIMSNLAVTCLCEGQYE